MLEAHIERHLPFCYLTIESEGHPLSATDEERIVTIVPRESWAKASLDAEGRAVLELERGYFHDPGYYDGYALTWVWTCLQTFTAAFDLTWLRWLAAQQNHLYLPSLYADPVPPPAIPEVGKTYRFTDQEIREASGLARLGATMHHVIGRKPGGAFDCCVDAALNADTPKSGRAVCSGEGVAMELVELTPGYVSIPQLAETLRAEGRRFARIDETLAFDKRFPWRADRQMLLCPGSFYRHPPLDDGRSLKLARIDYMVPREERYCVRLCARIFYLDQISLEQALVVCEVSFAPSFFLVVLNDPL